MPDNSGAVNLDALSAEDQEAVQRLAEERGGEVVAPEEATADNKREVHTAFLVLVGPDGSPEVLAFDDERLNVRQSPTPDIIYGVIQVLIKDLQAQETAAATVQATMAQARAMQEQMATQQMMKGLNLRG